MFALPRHCLQAGLIVRTVANTTKDDNQWTSQATGVIPVDFCDFKQKVVVFQTSRGNVMGFLELTRILCSYFFILLSKTISTLHYVMS
jgi:hypothetical protein